MLKREEAARRLRDAASWCLVGAVLEAVGLDPQVRQMAAVLLRRLLSASFEEIYPGLTLDMQTAIKAELLISIQQANPPNIRKKVCDIAAELCRNLIGKVDRLKPRPFPC